MPDRTTMRRREFIGMGAGVLALGAGFWRSMLDPAVARSADSAYGPLAHADANGLRLPAGFRSREIARAGQVVPGTSYRWHIFSDGQATFRTQDGGWILVSNSESLAEQGGGSAAIRFAADGSIAGAYRILSGTNANCAGGATPWGTWLSCEEHDYGHVWECAPGRAGQGVIRPAMGTFHHEAVAVDPDQQRLYMTEDRPDGGLYRFSPAAYPDLSAGRLEIAVDAGGGRVGWAAVPDPTAAVTPTCRQVPETLVFPGGEGIWFDSGRIYVSTKGDNRIRSYDTRSGALETLYDGRGALTGVDNLTVSRAGELFVCEDGGDMQIYVVAPGGVVAPFLQLTGPAANGSNELAGVVFDPAGERLYFAAQRAFGHGAVYEVSGPFRAASGPAVAPPAPAARALPHGDAPALRLRAPRRVSFARLRRHGIRVRVEADDAVEVSLVLRADDLRRVAGRRGSTARPATVTLDRARRRGRAVTARLRPRRRIRRIRRSMYVRVTALAVDAAGGRQVATRRVRVVGVRRRTRPRRG